MPLVSTCWQWQPSGLDDLNALVLLCAQVLPPKDTGKMLEPIQTFLASHHLSVTFSGDRVRVELKPAGRTAFGFDGTMAGRRAEGTTGSAKGNTMGALNKSLAALGSGLLEREISVEGRERAVRVLWGILALLPEGTQAKDGSDARHALKERLDTATESHFSITYTD